MKNEFLKLKKDLKELAIIIRRQKNKRKDYSNGYVAGLDNLRYKARHKHIVYCLLRGRSIEQIEPKVNPGNERDEYYIQKLLEPFKGEEDETLCAG